MGIRGKLVGSTLITLVIASLALIFVQFLQIGPYLEGLETNLATEKASQILRNIEQEGRRLRQLVNDWAYWDPSYQFMTGQYPAYERENLNSSSFESSNLSHLLIFTDAGDLVWGAELNLAYVDNLRRLSTSETTSLDFRRNLDIAEGAEAWTVLKTSNSWVLVAVQKIRSVSQGKISGHLVMARAIDDLFIGNLEEQSGTELQLSSIDSAGPVLSLEKTNTQTLLSVRINQTHGGPALRLSTRLERSFERSGFQALILSSAASLAVLFTFTLLTLIILTRNLIRPLKAFSVMINHVRTTGDYSKRIHWSSRDELGILASGINDLTQTVEASTTVLKELAGTDPLCGIANRRSFDETLDLSWKICKREKRPLGLIMVDVDQFKIFNDNYGHRAGDVCLRALAGAVKNVARRPGDLACRYGGEEMALILPNTDLNGVRSVAARLIEEVRLLAIPHAKSIHSFVTVSAGCASIIPDDTKNQGLLVETADKELYKAKSAGRNCYSPNKNDDS